MFWEQQPQKDSDQEKQLKTQRKEQFRKPIKRKVQRKWEYRSKGTAEKTGSEFCSAHWFHTEQ